MTYNQRKEFTEAEAKDIENLIGKLNLLDPEHEHVELLKGFNIGAAEKKSAEIIPFPRRGK